MAKTGPAADVDVGAYVKQRQSALAQLRAASDDVRENLIPARADTNASLLNVYLDINHRYFESDVYLGQAIQANTAYRLQTNNGEDPYYRSTLDELSGLRSGRGHYSGFEMLHPHFLPPLAERFFAIAGDKQHFASEAAFLRFLTIVNFAQYLIHLTKDGTGRAGEDFLVLLSQRHGFPLSLSLTSYRAAVDDETRLMFFRHVTERLGHVTVAQRCFHAQGYKSEPTGPVHIRDLLDVLETRLQAEAHEPLPWPDGLGPQVQALFDEIAPGVAPTQPELATGHIYRRYAEFLAKEVIYLLLCLTDSERLYAGLEQRYPQFCGGQYLELIAARSRSYSPVAADTAPLADEVVSRIDAARLGLLPKNDRSLRDGLERISAQHPILGALLTREASTQSIETLMQRVSVPNGLSLPARDFKDAVVRLTDFSL